MKYAVLRISNGSFKIEKEDADIDIIKDKYYELCRTYNSTPNIDATVKILDSNLDPYMGGKYTEHFVNVTPEPAQSE